MMRRFEAPYFRRLAALQNLTEFERRRELEWACGESDRLTAEAKGHANMLAIAEAELASLYAADRLCLDRLHLAAAIVGNCEAAQDRGNAAVDQAIAAEQQAGAAWLAARHLTKWLGDRGRELEKMAAKRRDERVEAEVRSLRLAIDGGGAA